MIQYGLFLFILVMAVFACEKQDCPPVVQDDPCAFDEAQVQAAFGKPYGVPRALDIDHDGAITNEDYANWTYLCQKED